MKQHAAGVAQSSVLAFASVLAFVAAFLVTGPLANATVDWVADLAAETYGRQFVGPVKFGWYAVVGAAVFFLARAAIAVALMFIGAWLTMRFGAFI